MKRTTFLTSFFLSDSCECSLQEARSWLNQTYTDDMGSSECGELALVHITKENTP